MEQGTWPVIVHKSLTSTDLPLVLSQRQLKVRFSESCVPGSVIFPKSNVAFNIVPLSKATETNSDSGSAGPVLTAELVERLDRFIHIHKKCFVLCVAPLHGDLQRQIYSMIQRKYMQTKLGMLPVHNTNEAVKTMLTIAKALCKPTSDMVAERLKSIISDQLQSDYMSTALKQLGLNSHECHLTEDGLGSLAKLASAERQQLLDCSLDKSTASMILSFFNNK